MENRHTKRDSHGCKVLTDPNNMNAHHFEPAIFLLARVMAEDNMRQRAMDHHTPSLRSPCLVRELQHLDIAVYTDGRMATCVMSKLHTVDDLFRSASK